MERATALVLVLAAVVLTTGCPFESEVPLGIPGPGSLDPALKGHWVTVEKGVDVGEAEFMPFNENEYYVELREKGKEPDRYRVYTVRIGGDPFLNCNEVKGDAGPASFYFARYSVRPDGTLAMRFVGDKVVPKDLAKDRRGLVGFLAAHLEGTALDDSDAPSIMRRPAPAHPAGKAKEE
jgi:hypothetical protein